ncbi:MAG: DUF1402 family protein [Rhizobiaceae bacterium]|nr:DUF1402 family protein [Rhizobiaceae bacterium]
MKLRAALPLLVLFSLTLGSANAATLVPEGNRNARQPDIPYGSSSRTRAANTTYEAKYNRVLTLLREDEQLRSKIVRTAKQYGIDPIHIVGAIVGEHTYNVDVYDRLQTYYVKAISYLQSAVTFRYNGENVGDFVERPQFEECADADGSYELWSCREAVWNAKFRGKTVDGTKFPDDRFGAVFFQPFYAGQTFGIGQLNPLTALQMSDIVNKTSGLPRLNHNRPAEVYRTIMDPDMSLAYMAAALKVSIDAYSRIAGFDISKNPGITATLYNIGDPEARARALKAENNTRRRRGQGPRMPRENYYGWLVNEKIEELRALF